MLVVEAAGDVGDVAAEVAVVGERLGYRHRVVAGTERLRRHVGVDEVLIASADTLAENPHLPAGVVEVVLARDGVARPVEQVRDGIAEHGVAAMPHRQRPCRIRRDVLDDRRLPGALVGPSVVRALREHIGDAAREVGVGEAEVDEAGPRDLHPRNAVGIDVERVHERLGDLPGVLLQRARELERSVRGEVAVLGPRRRLELDVEHGRVEAVVGIVRDLSEGVAELPGEIGFHARLGRWRASMIGTPGQAVRPRVGRAAHDSVNLRQPARPASLECRCRA